jgi:alpha-glucosidase (family GH31 glycosyl hydrolase)
MQSRILTRLALVLATLISSQMAQAAPTSLTNFKSLSTQKHSLIITSDSGQRLRITPYGEAIVRVQVLAAGEEVLPDNHYQMVERHNWTYKLIKAETTDKLHLSLDGKSGLYVDIQKSPLRLSFGDNRGAFLSDKQGTIWDGSIIRQDFASDSTEHFTGLGHGYFGRVNSLDLRGQTLERNYGRAHQRQAPLTVPFYISSKGYGLFLNSSFRNQFRFGAAGVYDFSIDTGNYRKDGQMDFFVISGPAPKDVLRNYVDLTGHARLPAKAMFGIALSDKGHAKVSDANWWQTKTREHAEAGFALDHMVNDNRWRAAGGERCKSKLAWDQERYPSPAEFGRWVNDKALAITLDFNRCIAPNTNGYDTAAFNIPQSGAMEFATAAPDFTNPKVRNWWWNVIFNQGIRPLEKTLPIGLWIDEFDEMGPAPDDQKLSNGRSFAEQRNYWFMLINQALVADGWDKTIGDKVRPFVWVRGNTAGGQRYSTLWSGDIEPSFAEMKNQIRGMQAAGLSGFPFWGHDAGGFDATNIPEAEFELLYRQWGLAMGSFSPFWKPHGMGPSRWPLDRSAEAQADFRKYSDLRYSLMPYTYSYAHEAYSTGAPIARPMLFNYPEQPQAWSRDLQYLWGNELLIAPNTEAPRASGNRVSIWLPAGSDWYDYWTDAKLAGNQTITKTAGVSELPIFVNAGAIIPKVEPAQSIDKLDNTKLEIHIYTGADGKFTLYEDDGMTDQYQKGKFATQEIIYSDKERSLTIKPVKGSYTGMEKERRYQVIFHGLEQGCIKVNDKTAVDETYWNLDAKLLWGSVPQRSVNAEVQVVYSVDCDRI